MTLYADVRDGGTTVFREKDFLDAAEGGTWTPAESAGKFDWRIINIVPDPVCDPLTEVTDSVPNYVINPTSVDKNFLCRPKTPEELDNDTQNDAREAAIDALELIVEGTGNINNTDLRASLRTLFIELFGRVPWV